MATNNSVESKKILLNFFLLAQIFFLNLNPCRSDIHGRGLFCKRNIDAGEMVIEYAGTVIRAVLTDKREKYYDSKVSNIMLRIVPLS